MDRIVALQGMLKADPTNCFVRYGLAQELVKLGEYQRAIGEFQRILDENADYQAAYYHAGKAFERLGRVDKAKAIYLRGIQASYRTGDVHARSELEAALEEISA